jgi:hypothetical protein
MLGGCLQKWVKFEGLVKLSQKITSLKFFPVFIMLLSSNF